jgi:hypothetical protein
MVDQGKEIILTLASVTASVEVECGMWMDAVNGDAIENGEHHT